jgi:hypothetical protein
MILVYKYVTAEPVRSLEEDAPAPEPIVHAKLVGDLPDEDSLVGFGEGDYCVIECATSKLGGGPDAECPSEIKSRSRREVYLTADGLKVRNPKR